MRNHTFVTLIILLTIVIPMSANAEYEGGKDNNPDDDVPFTIISRDAPSIDKTKWDLTIEMKQDYHENGTTFEIITQICTNDGVCDPPEVMAAEIDERLHTISLTPPDDHSYVNWRVKSIDSNGNKTNHPHGDWYKTWSSCWYNDGEYGGVDSTSDGCLENESEKNISGFLFNTSIVALLSSTIIIYRKHNNVS